MKNILNILLSISGICGTVFAVIMFIMAIVFGELGRVIFYFIIAILFIELSVCAILRLTRSRKICPREKKYNMNER